jgi:hypothetical protein
VKETGERKRFLRPEMQRILLSSLSAVMFLVLAGCQSDSDNIYADRWPYIYDYSEPAPAEAGVYRSGEAVLDGVLAAEKVWAEGVKATMGQGGTRAEGGRMEEILRQLYQPDLYE